MTDWSGVRVLITGGSQGIGLGIAGELRGGGSKSRDQRSAARGAGRGRRQLGGAG
ncbi:MAG: hypothetical protein U5N53_14310 [Mycobacterium sp.]|nr:hypothetical protein [Mycobacterium sp.]